MTHPIIDLQTSILSKLSADAQLTAAIGTNAIFDMPPKGRSGSYLVIIRHDLIVRDADLAPGSDHRLQLRVWVDDPSRAVVLVPAERVVAVITGQDMSTATLKATHVQHERINTEIDLKTGRANATMIFRILSEPIV